MYAETLFDARKGSDDSPTTAIVRHSSSMRRIVSGELIATTASIGFASKTNNLTLSKHSHSDETASIELRIS